jgi:hypothetical protein
MPLFGRQHRQPSFATPSAEALDAFGRTATDPFREGVAAAVDPALTATLLPDYYGAAQSDPQAFASLVAATAHSAGGWSLYGGWRLLGELLGFDYSDEKADTLRAAGIEWLRANRVPEDRVPFNEMYFWRAHGNAEVAWLSQPDASGRDEEKQENPDHG